MRACERWARTRQFSRTSAWNHVRASCPALRESVTYPARRWAVSLPAYLVSHSKNNRTTKTEDMGQHHVTRIQTLNACSRELAVASAGWSTGRQRGRQQERGTHFETLVRETALSMCVEERAADAGCVSQRLVIPCSRICVYTITTIYIYILLLML